MIVKPNDEMKTVNQLSFYRRIPDRVWWRLLVAFIVTMSIVIVATGCNTLKRAERRLAGIQATHPQLLARECADLYPVKTYDSIRTQFLPGAVILRRDTVRVDCDQVPPDSSGYRIAYMPCPPCLTRTDTLLRTWTQVRENTARVEEYRAKWQAAEVSRAKAEEQRNGWRLLALIFVGYCIIRAIIRLWFKINLP